MEIKERGGGRSRDRRLDDFVLLGAFKTGPECATADEQARAQCRAQAKANL